MSAFSAADSVWRCLSAGLLPQTERGDGEDRDHPHQRTRRKEQGPGELQEDGMGKTPDVLYEEVL